MTRLATRSLFLRLRACSSLLDCQYPICRYGESMLYSQAFATQPNPLTRALGLKLPE